MNSIFRIIRALTVALITAFGATAAHAQIPVTDALTLAQAVQQVTTLTSQLEQMKAQYTMLTSQYTAITGNHSYGQILNDASTLHNYLPDSWSSIYSNISSGSSSTLASSTNSIKSTEGLTAGSTTAIQRVYNVTAANKAMQMAAYNANIDRLNNIEALMVKADATQDASAKADLANRLKAEETMVQNEQTRLNMASRLQQSESDLSELQYENELKSTLEDN
ncbi:type IV secretion system protein [Paraburkholderia tropica]|uniref:type IV secretion system protein n=1 Tax=Paraburkholderia tropica TaxID=92647 RepID=UPI002AB5F830|nr:type IV secretion system protein [Paraburkholderia tropica]